MGNLIDSIGNFVDKSMTLFGIEVNTKRQMPYIYDGLKPSYRHVIYEELKTGPEMRKSADVAGSCMSTTHGHGDASLRGPISNLCRWGISKGQGNHGKKMIWGEDTEPAAMRYTETRISDKYLKIFSDLLPYVPYIDSEVKGKEPKYLPTPIPLCLSFGNQGIGLGVNCRIPAFTVPSMYEALINDDPSLLRSPFGLEIDPITSELDELWTKGVGKVTYKYKVSDYWNEGSFGYLIEGTPELFKPNLNAIDKLVKAGKVFVIDMTDRTGTRLFIAREYNIKSITHDEIKKLVETASVNTRTYRLTVADDSNVYLVPLREWLKTTYNNYLELIQKFKEDKIAKNKWDYDVYTWLPKVAEVFLAHRDWKAQQIADELSIDVDIVKAILSKTISALGISDTTEKLNKIQTNIDYYEGLNSVKMVESMINEF